MVSIATFAWYNGFSWFVTVQRKKQRRPTNGHATLVTPTSPHAAAQLRQALRQRREAVVGQVDPARQA